MPERSSTWTNLSESTAQVLFCDLQKEVSARTKTNEPAALTASATVLAEVAKLTSIPIVLSVVPEGERPPELLPGLSEATQDAPRLLRVTVSPFSDGETKRILGSSDRKVLILSGFAIEAVVLHAALDALGAGYQVLVPVDACGGMTERTEQAALRQMEAAGAVITSVVSIATRLAPDFSTEQGKQVFEVVQRLRLA